MRLDSRVKASEEVISTELDGEAVLMHVSHGTYYGLNAVGAVIWTLMKEPVTVERLCAAVVEEFEVEREVCERDAFALLQELKDAGLVEIVCE